MKLRASLLCIGLVYTLLPGALRAQAWDSVCVSCSASASRMALRSEGMDQEIEAEVEPGIGVRPFEHFPKRDHYRLTIGGGASAGLLNDAPYAYGAQASYQHGAQLYSAWLLENTNGQRRPSRSYLTMSALYGYAVTGEIAHRASAPDEYLLSVSPGLALIVYQERWRFRRFRGVPPDSATLAEIAAHPNVFSASVGLPIQVQAFWAPYPFAGVGATLFGVFSRFKPNYGAMLSLELGWF